MNSVLNNRKSEMSPAVRALIKILKGEKHFKMELHSLEKSLAERGVLGLGVEPIDVLKRALDEGVCTYDSEKRITYLDPRHFRRPLHLLPKDDPRRRHLASDLPVCEIRWDKDMEIEDRKRETKNLISGIPGGYTYGLDANLVLVAYSETFSSLSKFLRFNKFHRVCIYYKQVPGTVYLT